MGSNIAVLAPHVAAKIAAGEVIERPSAVVRELLDNAIDAGATQISLYLEEGGLQLIRISDDGIGMSRADLELCYLPHATSKIIQVNDLLNLNSLGFRGEALASIAACSTLRISSAQESTDSRQLNNYELRVSDSTFLGLEPIPAVHNGTQVEVRELFYSFPPRRKFLKSSRSEWTSCKAVFQDKALAFPHIHFRLYHNGKVEQTLTPGSAIERICQVYTELAPEQLFLLEQRAEHFSLQLYAVAPNTYRRDRKRMTIYINQRPIVESSLQQAIRIGFEGYLAGGLFPVCFCFIEAQPDRVDFNIHPAKREARLRDLSLIQASIRQAVRNFCRKYGGLHSSVQANSHPELNGTAELPRASGQVIAGGPAASYTEKERAEQVRNPGSPLPSGSRRNSNFQQGLEASSFSVRELQRDRSTTKPEKEDIAEPVSPWNPISSQLDQPEHQDFHYFGQLFEVFLLVERYLDGEPHLLIVDQHASHERILYETLEQEMLQRQPLLVPIELPPDADATLEQRSDLLAEIGIELKQAAGSWQISSLPPSVSDLKEELIELVLHGASEAEDLKRELFAHLSCRKAIKKGDILDKITAHELLHTLFQMGLERCPHGRPLWYSLSQQQLYHLLQRT